MIPIVFMMKPTLLKIITRSLIYYRKDTVYQVIIVILLSAIITGSLLTGTSVRSSLRRTTSQKSGNARIIVSSGQRFFSSTLAEKITEKTGRGSVAILETEGYCTNFSTGLTVLNVRIFGVTDDFFQWNSTDSLSVIPGDVAVNYKFAEELGIRPGDEIIIRFKPVDPLPANAPFAPSKDDKSSKVLRVSHILTPENGGNFSPGISQVIPKTIFMNIADIGGNDGGRYKANRLFFSSGTIDSISSALEEVISLSDIGFTVRRSEKTGESEIISDRIFIDSTLVSDILEKIPSGSPVLTYLVNSFSFNGKKTPYSFVASMPPSLFPVISGEEIVLNRWLAHDLDIETGDSVVLRWYDPTYGNNLEENEKTFLVSKIIDDNHRYADPSLMPDFPGISGSTTCSGWDAGVPILLDQIREKDEEYWNNFRGTPKAFISYPAAKIIWGNNFGVATAIRFPGSLTPEEIENALYGNLDPADAGLTVTDIRKEGVRAASEGVDFSSLFLGLGFFIILSCLILFSIAVTVFFDTRKKDVRAYYSIGFRNRQIKLLLFSEIIALSAAGAIPGIFCGLIVNRIVISALNSVWQGAVQTNTLSADYSVGPILTGFFSVLVLTAVVIYLKTSVFLKRMSAPPEVKLKKESHRTNLIWILAAITLTSGLFISALLDSKDEIILFFTGGVFLFGLLVILMRYYYIYEPVSEQKYNSNMRMASKKYYSYNPSHAVTPAIIIAAGIFAVIITGANRQVVTERMLSPDGGTGGYLLWAESAIPIMEDLNLEKSRIDFGFNSEEFRELLFVQCRRVSGDDASCLNLNHVTSPPILSVDPHYFTVKGSFSFASTLHKNNKTSPWTMLDERPDKNTIYGIADETVLRWGLRKDIGDTLQYRAENGHLLNIVICGGLKSSVFQGHLLIGSRNFSEFFPSVSGSSIFLVDGNRESLDLYIKMLQERLSAYGVSVQPAGEKLASFFVVTNTYLDVFVILGVFGLVLGVAGLGFILARNYNVRKREFALLSAIGYSQKSIQSYILTDQTIILIWGIITGISSGLASTWPSLRNGSEMPWKIILLMGFAIFITGYTSLRVSVRNVRSRSLVTQLRRE
jgi:ABC-type antimicrobial peptide transport system permease subunit